MIKFIGSSTNTMEARCIERHALLERLAQALPDGCIRFNSKLVSIHKKTGSLFTTLELTDGTSITAKVGKLKYFVLMISKSLFCVV